MLKIKFVLQIQPADVVLSVMDKPQSPFVNHPSKMSIQGMMIDAMNSSRLFVALNLRFGGTL